MRDWYFLNSFLLASPPFIRVHVVDKIRTHLPVGKTLLQDKASWFIYWDHLSQGKLQKRRDFKVLPPIQLSTWLSFFLSVHSSLPPSSVLSTLKHVARLWGGKVHRQRRSSCLLSISKFQGRGWMLSIYSYWIFAAAARETLLTTC